jgi:hypothetical protein
MDRPVLALRCPLWIPLFVTKGTGAAWENAMNRNLRKTKPYVTVSYRHSIWNALLAFGFALVCMQVHAADICVLAGDYLGLQAALTTAAQNAEDDLVMLQSGHYYIPSTFGIAYSPTDQHNLTITGGYTEFNSDPCGWSTSADARQTILDGGKGIDLRLPVGSGSVTLSTLTVTGVFNPGTAGSHAAISIWGFAGTTGSVQVSNAIFAGNGNLDGAAISISSTASVMIENSLFYQNYTYSGLQVMDVWVDRPDNGPCVLIVHSTFTQNTTDSRLSLSSETCMNLLANDIFWGNTGRDLDIVYTSTPALVTHVDVMNLSDLGNATTSQILSQDPLFNPDFSLSDFSPLRDAGVEGGFLFANGTYDVFGNSRIYGAKPDIGAFEISDVIFAHAFDW